MQNNNGTGFNNTSNGMNNNEPNTNYQYNQNYIPPQQQIPTPYPQPNPNLKPCKYCRQYIDKTAKICPYCRKKQGSSTLAIIAAVIIVVFIIPAMFGARGSSNSKSNTSTSSSSSSSSSSYIAEEKSPVKSTVTMTNYYLTSNYSGDTILIVEYSYTNNNDKAQSFMWEFNDKCYQNGVECSDIILGVDDIDTGKQSADVLPGVTSKFKVGYKVEKGSEVNVIVTRYLHDDDVVIDEKINIKP